MSFFNRLLESKENNKSLINQAFDNLEIKLIVDGKNLPLENHEIIDESPYSITVDIQLGIRDILKRHPFEYNPELHYPLLTDEERRFFENYGRIEE